MLMSSALSRYVGLDAASKINEEGITFDEYYAYYVANQ